MPIDIVGMAPRLDLHPAVTQARAAQAEDNDRRAAFPSDGIRRVRASCSWRGIAWG